MARVALVIPNFAMREQFGDISDPPIGVALIGGYLERHGHDVLVVDGMGEDLADDEILRRLADFKPGLVGIGCNYCILHNATLEIARRIRDVFGRSVVVFAGGNHASAMAHVLLRQSQGAIDCIARGEGEPVTLGLVKAGEAGDPLRKVPGLSFVEADGIVDNPSVRLTADLDRFGMPAYHLLPMERYKRYNIVSMRGCPFSCSFCASTVLFGRKVRYRTPDSVVAEIEHLYDRYGDRQFWFSDDTFTANRVHTLSLLKAIRDRNLPIKWSCLTTVNTVKAEVLEAMRDSGCLYVSYGIETGNAGHLKYIGKAISADGIKATSRLTRSVGLRQYGFFIVGFPGETWETVYDTYRLILESELDGGGMNILIPLPGTRLWTMLFEERKVFSLEEMRWDELFARLPDEGHNAFPAQLASRWTHLSPEDLVEACRMGWRMLQVARHIKGSAGGQSR